MLAITQPQDAWKGIPGLMRQLIAMPGSRLVQLFLTEHIELVAIKLRHFHRSHCLQMLDEVEVKHNAPNL